MLAPALADFMIHQYKTRTTVLKIILSFCTLVVMAQELVSTPLAVANHTISTRASSLSVWWFRRNWGKLGWGAGWDGVDLSGSCLLKLYLSFLAWTHPQRLQLKTWYRSEKTFWIPSCLWRGK